MNVPLVRRLLACLLLLLACCAPRLVHAYGPAQCAADRFGSNLNCTSNDVSITTIAAHGGIVPTCIAGQPVTFDLDVTVQFASPLRYDVGIFVSQDGNTNVNNTSATGGPATCSVAILPTSAPFLNGNGNGCGDGDSTINGGTGKGTITMSVTVPCITPTGNSLSVPFVVSWANNANQLSSCGSINDPVPGTSAKCNAPTGLSAAVTVIVVPTITITDNKTTTFSGDVNTYQIVISNNSGSSLIGATFTDPSVANLNVSGVSCSASGGASCPAPGNVTVGAMQVGGIALPTIPNGGSLTFTVVGTVTGTFTAPTTLTNTASVIVSGRTNTASDTDTVYAQPQATKSFSPATIGVNGSSILSITLTNPNSVPITGVGFTDNYPANMATGASPGLTNSCAGSANASATSLSLSNATLAAGANCKVTVNVTATAAGSYDNSTGQIGSSNAGAGLAAGATLTVLSAPNVGKAFSPSTIPVNGSSTLTISLSNPNGVPITGVNFTDNYPANLKNAATLNLTNSCGGSVTAAAGDNKLALSGGTIPVGGCSISVNVTSASAGIYNNNTGPVATGNAGTGNAAGATLTVLGAPTAAKSFNPATTAVNGSSALTIGLSNPNSVPITGVNFTDNYPANLKNAATLNLTNSCGGSVTAAAGDNKLALSGGTIPVGGCSISVNVTSASAGVYNNNTGPVTTGNAGNGNAATASLTVVVMPTATLSFAPNPTGINSASVMTVTLTNPTATPVSAAFDTGNYPSNLSNAAAPNAATSCSSGAVNAGARSLSLSGATIPANSSCTVTVSVIASAAGNYTVSTGTITSNAATGDIAAASGTLSVLAPLIVAVGFSPAAILVNGTSTLTITLSNPNATAVGGVGFSNTFPANFVISGGVSNTCGGSAVAGTSGGFAVLTLSGGSVAGNSSCSISMSVSATAAGSFTGSTGTVSTSNAGGTAGPSATLVVSAVSNFNAFETGTAAGATSGRIYTKIAGAAFDLDVVALGPGGQATSFNGNVRVELVANNAAAGSGYGSDNCPSDPTAIETISSAAIAGGRSRVSFSAVADVYKDVRVRITYSGGGSPVTACSTDSFALRPASLALAATDTDWQSAGLARVLNNNVNSLASNPVIHKAGRAFTVSARALNAVSAVTANYVASIKTSDNPYGFEVSLASCADPPANTNTGCPASVDASKFSFGAGSFTSGLLRSDTPAYDDVGSFYLTMQDAHFADIDIGDGTPADCTGRYVCSAATLVGRFVPDHFAVSGSLATRSDLPRAAGTVSAGSSLLNLSPDSGGIIAGNLLVIEGAGPGGTPLQATVTGISGSTATLSSVAASSASGANVYNLTQQSGFTYLDEPMLLAATVTALNAHDTTTPNYAGAFAKLDAAALGTGASWTSVGCGSGVQCFGLGAVNIGAASSTALTSRLAVVTGAPVASPVSSWSAGVGYFAAHLRLARPTTGTPDATWGPYETLKLGAAPQDAEGVTLPDASSTDSTHKVNLDADVNGTPERREIAQTIERFGRLKLSNATGSEKVPLAMPVQAQYWTGASWALNSADSLTPIRSPSVVLTNYRSAKPASPSWTTTATGPVPLASGQGAISLSAPSAGGTGSVDVCVDLGADPTPGVSCSGTGLNMPYLQGKWPPGTSYGNDPKATATFGVYTPEWRRAIHVRELF